MQFRIVPGLNHSSLFSKSLFNVKGITLHHRSLTPVVPGAVLSRRYQHVPAFPVRVTPVGFPLTFAFFQHRPLPPSRTPQHEQDRNISKKSRTVFRNSAYVPTRGDTFSHICNDFHGT